MTIETEISARIRATVSKLRKTPMPAADLIPLMQTAAEMCDRYYSGMMNWKENAQAKDKSIAELNAQLAAPVAAQEPFRWFQERTGNLLNAKPGPEYGHGWQPLYDSPLGDAQDAARYRYLRDTTKAIRDDTGENRIEVTPNQFDAAVDKARKAAPAAMK